MTVTSLRPPFTIGGSEAAACAGIDPHTSPVLLWARKTGRAQPEPDTEAMRWGRLLEPVIFEALQADGYTVTRTAGMEFRDGFRVGHPDGLIPNRGVVEAKTAGHWANAHGNDGPPLHYQAQVQHYLHLTGLDEALLAVLVAGQRLEVHELRREPTAIELLLAAEQAMYDRLVSDEPPPALAKGDALVLHPEATPDKRIRETKEAREIRRELEARLEQEKAVKAQVVALKEAYQHFMGDAAIAINQHDWPVAKWPMRTDKRVSVKLLREQRPELASLFEEETVTRRFQIL